MNMTACTARSAYGMTKRSTVAFINGGELGYRVGLKVYDWNERQRLRGVDRGPQFPVT